MSEAEEFEDEVFGYNISLALLVGVVVCIFGRLPIADWVTIFIVLLFFSFLLGLVRGVIPPIPILTTLFNTFNFSWFYYWFYFEGELILAITIPVVAMICSFAIGGVIYRKRTVDKYYNDKN